MDIQAGKSPIEIHLPKVGINEFRVPVKYRQKSGGTVKLETIVSMYVSLNAQTKGINMCYDAKTEILTKERGWIRFADLTQKDFVATLNKDTGYFEWQQPIAIHTSRYKGRMYLFDNSAISLCVTPNHNMVVFEHNGKLIQKEARAIYNKTTLRFKKDCKWIGENPSTIRVRCKTKRHKERNDLVFETRDFMKLLGFYIAEGCIAVAARGYSYAIILSCDYKPILEEMTVLLTKYGIKSTIQPNGAGHYKLCFVNKALGIYFRKLGKSSTRYIPIKIKNLAPELLKVLYDYYFVGDGSKSERAICTSSKQLADDFQEISIKCGCSMNISQYIKKQGFHPGMIEYRGYWIKDQLAPLMYTGGTKENRAQRNDQWIEHDGDVYCCTVPNSIILVRRENKTKRLCAVWCGNSRLVRTLYEHIDADHDISIDLMEMILKDFQTKLKSTDSYLKFKFNYPIRKQSLITKASGWVYYPVVLESKMVNKQLQFMMEVKVYYSSTCPCSASLSKDLEKGLVIREGKNVPISSLDDVDKQRYTKDGQIQPQSGTAHAQRSEANIRLIFDKEDPVWIEDVVKLAEDALKTPVQVVVKRPDEQFFAKLNFENQMFVEDAVRRVSEALDIERKILDFSIACVHAESLHPFNAVSVNWKGIPGGLR